MMSETFDWGSIESIFIVDETYESLKAPKWVDLSAPDELVDDEAWFCNPGKDPFDSLMFLISYIYAHFIFHYCRLQASKVG